MGTLKSTFLLTALFFNQAVFSEITSQGQDHLKKQFQETKKENYFSIVVADPLSVIDPNFNVTPYFLESTEFWFKIYTIYGSNEVVLHDRNALSLIYNATDFSKSKATQDEHQKQFKEALLLLAKGDNNCQVCPQILQAIERSKLKIPKHKKERKKFFTDRALSLRYQTGQSDFIEKGFQFFAPYKDKIDQLIELYEIPEQLVALSFLESSFNVNARSRVGATGVWQFMKRTGQYYMIVTPRNDHRLNPLLSTLGAFQLLKQNRKLLGRWDLAIWSYNSGTRAVQKAQKKLNLSNMSLEKMLETSESDRIKFASTNFYSSFLALVHALAYREHLYSAAKINSKVKTTDIEFYVSLCSFTPSWFFGVLKDTSPMIKKFNSHIRSRYHKTTYPRGTILVSDRPLTERRYFKVPEKNYTNRYTKNWRLLIKNQSCSTK